ncbi:class II fructose-bisphosphate aldolase [Bacillaceae bacterium SIJ1]|uniref:class II fructose-bisphosphate aldolase n=1 Tax=Litoribacterium kuwaitense TaxID=1398745 RepID=UPI0013ED93B9|nr:class II fructose-bisphosphate aldolase [Litoribacterium kuwaitense]NGP43816.1 class II fructose-bisphosphate aldolase [Litoribacterium kuwaitense]
MIADFNKILNKAAQNNYALAAFNVFGYEDAHAVIQAAEDMNAPILLATNQAAIDHMPIQCWGRLLRSLAEDAHVPVSIHLDHAKDFQTVADAIHSGYTSVMYDGSHLPLHENIKNTKEITKMAHAFNVPVEGEVGKLSYEDIPGQETEFTDPEEAKIFVEETGVDWLAVSVGTVQRMAKQEAEIQFQRLKAIEQIVKTPLVIHGSSGVTNHDLKKLIQTKVSKLNIGTALRVAFGHSLANQVAASPQEYDRLKLFAEPMDRVKEEALNKLHLLGFNS